MLDGSVAMLCCDMRQYRVMCGTVNAHVHYMFKLRKCVTDDMT